MNTVKRLVVCLTCIVVLLSSFVFNSSAVEYDPYTGEEMLYDVEGGYYYSLPKPSLFEPFMPLITTEPSYPGFDINKLPWLEMPSYVQEILYGEPQGNVSDSSYSGTYKLPFVLVLIQGSTIHLTVGWNLFLGSYFTEADSAKKVATSVYVSAYKSSTQVYQHSVCYHARYKLSDYSLYLDWTEIDPIAVGDNFVRYYGLPYPNGGSYDCYLYGFNGVKPGIVTFSARIYEDAALTFPVCRVVNNPKSGFAGGSFIYYPDNISNYFTSFTPPTAEQLQASTSKGIWESVKEIPSKIGEFFVELRNYLLYFQPDKPDHINPFNDLLTDIKAFFDEQMSDIVDFKNSLNTTLENVVGYISSGSGIINTVLFSVPMLSAFVTFFVVFSIVRKVIGR